MNFCDLQGPVMGTVGNKEMRRHGPYLLETQTNRNWGELSKLGKLREDSIKIVKVIKVMNRIMCV